MTKEEAEEYIYASYLKAAAHQDYSARDAEKRHPELTRDLIHSLGKTPAVLVTGSKGKGSVANMIAAILQSRLTVGLLTSPHILDFTERFRVDGIPVSDADFVSCMEEIRPAFERIEENLPEGICISPMGIQAALALTYFNRRGTDFNVLECGKGAQYDDVANARHDYAVINTVFLEHTRELGSTLEEIAADKAHVIDGEQKCVYVAPQEDSVLEVVSARAKDFGVPLKIYGKDFSGENIIFTKQGMRFDVRTKKCTYEDVRISLLGSHQARNCALAIALCEDALGGIDLPEVKKRLDALTWPGRMEVLSQEPFIMLDACINRASTVPVKETLKELGIGEVTVVIGIPDDKDFCGVAEAMAGISNHIILTKSQNPHYVFTKGQVGKLAEKGISAEWIPDTEAAVQQAKAYGLPFAILGTTSVVAEVEILKGQTSFFAC